MQENDNNSSITILSLALDNRKDEWLTPMRYIIVPGEHFSALMQAESYGWILASNKPLVSGEMISSYVNGATESHFQKLSCILNRINIYMYGENGDDKKLQIELPYYRLQQQFFILAELLRDLEAACGCSGIFTSIINRADYLERHLARLDISRDQISEISRSIDHDISVLRGWQKFGREILVEISDVAHVTSGYSTGAYMLDLLWQHCLIASPQLSQTYIGGFMAVPLHEHGKGLDLRSDLELILRRVCQGNTGGKSNAHSRKNVYCKNIFKEVDKRSMPDHPRMIVEYKEVTSPELPLIWDLVECLKYNYAPKICPVCGKAFPPSGGMRVYCSRECGTSANRNMVRRKKWAKNAIADTVMPEAKRYLLAMRTRVNYVSKGNKPHKGVTAITSAEYNMWYDNYKKEMKKYMNIRASETDKEIIEKAGVEFLDRIRPNGYKPHRRKNG